MIEKLTPILYVDAIEPQLELWEQRLGFERTASVPHEGRLGFVILARDGVELMLQTHASVEADVKALHDPQARTAAGLYLETSDLDACAAKLDGLALVVPRRFTFYGAEELGVRAPSQHAVVFAHYARPEKEPKRKAKPKPKAKAKSKPKAQAKPQSKAKSKPKAKGKAKSRRG